MNDCFEFPVNYNDEDLKILESSHRMNFEVTVRKMNVKNELTRLQKGVGELRHYSLQEFQNAILMCKSRIFNQKHKMMVPLADMVNHRYDGNVKWAYDENKGFSLTAKEDIEKDALIETMYSMMDQYYAFLNYGFIPSPPKDLEGGFHDANPFDTLSTIVTIPEFIFT